MKLIVTYFWALLLLFAGCSKDELTSTDGAISNGTDIAACHFYGSAYSGSGAATKGVAQRTNLWYPCSTIKVRFLNDPYNMAAKVKTYASEWEKYAGIHFEFVESGNAHVRIGFDWNDERYITWSYIGTDCKMVTNQNEATMSFAYWDSSTEQEIKGDVLRAFGQVLGLELEHRHLSFDAGWTSRIASYWEGEIEDVTWDNLRRYVFDPLEASEVIQTAEYDENSIMIWPFSSRYASNTARSFNYELSPTDKTFIAQLYPKCEDDEEPIVTGTVGIFDHFNNYDGWFDVVINGDIIVDWGDGVVDTLFVADGSYVNTFHTYADNTDTVTFKIYGDPDAIIALSFSDWAPSYLNISKCVSLKSLDWWAPFPVEIDLSNNLLLEHLSLVSCYLTRLDLSNNVNLKSLNCNSSRFTSLDLSNNPLLESLYCNYNQLTVLDISNNPLLSSLSCNSNHLTELCVSYNTLLTNLNCSNNQLISLDVSNNQVLSYLICNGNTFVNDQTAMIQLAQSLPDRTSHAQSSSLIISNSTAKSWIQDICTAKNWTVN